MRGSLGFRLMFRRQKFHRQGRLSCRERSDLAHVLGLNASHTHVLTRSVWNQRQYPASQTPPPTRVSFRPSQKAKLRSRTPNPFPFSSSPQRVSSEHPEFAFMLDNVLPVGFLCSRASAQTDSKAWFHNSDYLG